MVNLQLYSIHGVLKPAKKTAGAPHCPTSLCWRKAMVDVRGVFHLGAASKVLPSLKLLGFRWAKGRDLTDLTCFFQCKNPGI